MILGWADAHFARTRHWPIKNSGRIVGAIGEKWENVHANLVRGGRGLSGGITLAQLLERERGVVNRKNQPRLNLIEHKESLLVAALLDQGGNVVSTIGREAGPKAHTGMSGAGHRGANAANSILPFDFNSAEAATRDDSHVTIDHGSFYHVLAGKCQNIASDEGLGLAVMR